MALEPEDRILRILECLNILQMNKFTGWFRFNVVDGRISLRTIQSVGRLARPFERQSRLEEFNRIQEKEYAKAS